jgi:hypothetical protein
MKKLFTLIFICAFSSAFSQITGPLLNPQLSPGFLYTNYDNIFMPGGLFDGKQINLETSPKCKVEKIKWENNNQIPCFKITEIPLDAKQVIITIIGGSGKNKINYGSINVKVSNQKPKN